LNVLARTGIEKCGNSTKRNLKRVEKEAAWPCFS